MIRMFVPALAAVLALGFATSSLAAPTLVSVTPVEGTVGTTLTITGTELGTRAPKAVLKLHGDATAKPLTLKVTKPFDGTTVHATVLKIQAGVYDLVVTPSKGQPITLDSAFTGRAPVVSGLSAAKIAFNELLTINGTFFGTKRGKIVINGIKQTIKIWDGVLGKIVVKISKKTGVGTFSIDIQGVGGTTTNAAQAQFVAPIAGADYFKADFDNGGPDMVCHDIKNTPNVAKALDGGAPIAQSHLIGSKSFGGGITTNNHLLDIAVLGQLNEGAVFSGGQVFVTFTELGIASSTYLSQGAAAGTVTINQRAGNRISGSYTVSVNKQTGGGPAAFTISGDFILTIR